MTVPLARFPRRMVYLDGHAMIVLIDRPGAR
jgi:hypothetical protein